MELIHFKANGDFCIVDVPEGATDFRISYGGDEIVFKLNEDYKRIRIDKGNWKIFGLQSEIEKSEEASKKIIYSWSVQQVGMDLKPIGEKDISFNNYLGKHGLPPLHSPTESFQSLMQSLECYLVNPYGKVPECGCMGHSDGCECCDKFVEAMGKVSERLILKKV